MAVFFDAITSLFMIRQLLLFSGGMKWKTEIMEYAVSIVVNAQVETEE
jgi:hypothetical protein